jgi:cytochrome c-type biogenesis protein CcmH/NrfG
LFEARVPWCACGYKKFKKNYMETEQKIFVKGYGVSKQNSATQPVRQMLSPSFQKSLAPTQHSSEQSITKIEKESFVRRFFGVLISVSLIALFLGLPLFFTGRTLQGVVFEKEMYFYFWVLLALVSWVSQGVMNREICIRKTPLDVPIVLFLGAYALSVFTSIDRWRSFWGSFGDPSRGFFSVVACVLIYYIVLSHFDAKRLRLIVVSLVVSILVMILWSLLAVFGVHFLPTDFEQRAPLSLMGSLTALMVFLGSSLSLLIASISLVYANEKKRNKLYRWVLLSILGVGMIGDLALLFLLFPYVSWWAVIIGLAFFLLYILAQVIKIEDCLTWIPMVSFVVLLAFYMIGVPDIIKTTLPTETMLSAKPSWDIAKESLRNTLFFGSGPASYGYDFSLYRSQDYNQQPLSGLRFNQGTGLFFEAVATLGVIGSVAFLLLLLSFLSIGYFFLAQKKALNKILSLGLWSMMASLLVAAISVQFNGALVLVTTLVASLALAVSMNENQADKVYRTLSLHASPKFALTLAFVFLMVCAGGAFFFVFVGKAFWADVLAYQSMSAPANSNDSVDKMTKATQYMPKESYYIAYLGQIYLALAMQELNKSKDDQRADVIKKDIDLAENLVVLARSMSNRDLFLYDIVGQTYESTLSLTGMRQNALDTLQKNYEEASLLEPHNPVYYAKLGQIKQSKAQSSKGDEQKDFFSAARDLFQKSVDEKDDFIVGYLYLGLAQESLGSIDDAIGSLTRGTILGRQSVDTNGLRYNLARLLRIRGKDDDLKIAEFLLKEIIANDDKDISATLILGLTYEQMDKKDDAIIEYQKVLSLIDGQNADDAKKQVQTFIDTVKAGKSNVSAASKTPATTLDTEDQTMTASVLPTVTDSENTPQ